MNNSHSYTAIVEIVSMLKHFFIMIYSSRKMSKKSGIDVDCANCSEKVKEEEQKVKK